MANPTTVQAALLDHGRRMLVSDGHLAPILHATRPDVGTPMLSSPAIEKRYSAVREAFAKGATVVCLLYDGYVTELGKAPHPDCEGRGCEACRGTGYIPTVPRQDALIILTFQDNTDHPAVLAQRYRRIEAGSYLFEAPQDFTPRSGHVDHAYGHEGIVQ